MIEINPKDDEAYINLFELQLIQNQVFNQKIEKEYKKRFKETKESFINYEMLKVLQNILQGKVSNLEVWCDKYEGIIFNSEHFYRFNTWIEQIENDEIKGALIEALEIIQEQ